jgi:hypothetical protein
MFVQYTGDFRYDNIGLETLTALHDADGRVLSLDELYLDTTFCSKSYLRFPSRVEALQVRAKVLESDVFGSEK